MSRFLLKVIEHPDAYVTDDHHNLGGVDLMQRFAFAHLFPEGFCDWAFRDLLFKMADAHGWDVAISYPPKAALEEQEIPS